MLTGALIVAAGMSSRMGDFKPMLELGSISIAQRTVANFRQVGVDRIVMITGYNAEILERHLSGNGITFLRNENYASSQMFDSAKIGLEYLKDKVDVILFTPVDIPLVSASTIESLIASSSGLAMPVCGGEIGHPIKIASSLAEGIIGFEGEGGLKAALDSCCAEREYIEVDDPGILHDADTPEDYSSLLKLHNSQLIRPEVQISLSKELPFFNEKMAMLLSLVEETSNVREACQRMQISYSSGWNIIKNLEQQLSSTLISRSQGGAHGSSSELTPAGKKLLESYLAYSAEIKKTANRLFDEYFKGAL